jgi:hypothetical protein
VTHVYGLEFIRHHLPCARHTAKSEDSARCNGLEHVRAAVNGTLCFLPELVGPASDSCANSCRDILLSVPGNHQVPAAAGYRQVVTRHLHPRSVNLPTIDAVAKHAPGPSVVGANISRRRKSGPECGGCIRGGYNLFVFLAAGVINTEISRIGRFDDMGMGVDQSGQTGVFGQVDVTVCNWRAVRHGFDPAIHNGYGLPGFWNICEPVDQRSAIDCNAAGV